MSFTIDRYAVLRGLVPLERTRALYAHALAVAEAASTFRADPQVPGTPSAYGDPHMEALLEELVPRLERETGTALFPTYSYFRVYKPGDALAKHTDRASCELSVSLALGYRAEAPWPLWVERGGEARPIALSPGDALLYAGMEVPHWREPFAGQHHAQVFLHYVDQHGPHRGLRFDERPALGT